MMILIKESNKKENYTQEGSITVFLTMIFVLLMAVITAAFENVRILSSRSYVSVAADSAIRTIFGNYNKELYDEYHLFGYGGYSGKGAADFEEEFYQILEKNLAYKPKFDLKSYSDLYRLGKTECTVEEYTTLIDNKMFDRQVSEYLKISQIDNISSRLSGRFSKEKQTESAISDNFDETDRYEKGEYSKEKNKNGNSEKQTENRDLNNKKISDDTAGGNPLTALKNLIGSGLLSLVCDEKNVSDKDIEITDEKYTNKKDTDVNADLTKIDSSKSNSDKEENLTGNFFKKLLDGGNNILNTETADNNISHVSDIAYSQKVFSCYTRKLKKTVDYGLEYLVAGKKNEKENISSIVERLLAVRTLTNYIYVSKDTGFKSKSLVTATAIAGFTGLEALITAIQQTILVILSFEEACVDVCALLEDKAVPLTKNFSNFKMTYEEICLASRALFEEKAQLYGSSEDGKLVKDITYRQYLWFFEIMTPEDRLRNRMFKLMEYDLKERFNQTFCIDTCICNAQCSVSYKMPYIYSYAASPLKNMFLKNISDKCITVKYGYADYE